VKPIVRPEPMEDSRLEIRDSESGNIQPAIASFASPRQSRPPLPRATRA
jgi:hypothetical protein